MEKPVVVVIGGPTASGKTGAAIALCQRIGGEVISADSMQVYRGMDIGTAKPSLEERQGIVHHLLDVVSPNENYAAGMYREDAIQAIAQIRARGHVPVLCGGTGLYISAVIHPMGFALPGDEALRQRLLQEDGAALHRRLSVVDPESAARLHPNDLRRVVRALEVYELTGETMSAHRQRDALRQGDYRTLFFALNWPRAELYARIDRRVEQMMAQGLVGEVQALLREGVTLDTSTAMQALGYKEIARALSGICSMQEAVAAIQQGSRNYAKRQMTWLRREPDVRWLEAEGKSAGELAEEMIAQSRAVGIEI